MNKKSSSKNIGDYKSQKRVVTLLAVIIWIISIVSAFFISWNQQLSSIRSIMMQSITQSQFQTDQIYGRIKNISSRLLRQQDIASWLYSRNDSLETRSSLIGLLSSYTAASDDIVGSIGIFNSYLERYITSSGTMPVSGLGNPVGNEQFSMRPREIVVTYTEAGQQTISSRRILSFYTRVDENPQRTNQGVLVVNIEEDVWKGPQEMLISESSYYLLNEDGIVLSSSDDERYITDLSYDPDFARLFQALTISELGENNKNQSIFLSIDGDNTLLVWSISERTELISLVTIPAAVIIRQALLSAAPWFMLLAVLFAVIFTITLKILKSINEPVQKMIKYMSPGMLAKAIKTAGTDKNADFSLIQSALLYGEKSGQVAEEKYLLDLIEGRNTVGVDLHNAIPVELQKGPWLIIVCRFDSFNNFETHSIQDLNSYRFMTINVTQELLADSGGCRGVVTAENEMVFYYSPTDSSTENENDQINKIIDKSLDEAQQYLRQYFGFTVSYVWTQMYNDISNLNDYVKEARRLFSFRFIDGPLLRLDISKLSANSKRFKYQAAAEKHIIEAVNLKQEDKLSDGIKLFIGTLSDNYSIRAEDYINQLMFTVFKQVEHTVELQDSDYEIYVNTVKKIGFMDNLNEVASALDNFCTHFMSLSHEKTKDMLQQKHDQLISDIRHYLAENMSDFDISLESTAENFRLSSGYLGKLFKSATGENFSHYLIDLRLNEAVRLLTETSLPAKTICEKVGMINVTYFSTLFKKHMGLSPIRYREKIQKDSYKLT